MHKASTHHGEEKARKGRGPSPHVTESVMLATIAILKEKGGAPLSMEEVASRADIHKTTLYRRWGNTAELVKSAIQFVDLPLAELPDSGSLKSDMIAIARRYAALFLRPEVVAINRILAGSRDSDNNLGLWLAQYWASREGGFHAVFERAIERGEPICENKAQLAMEVIVGPMLMRALLTEDRVDGNQAEELGVAAYSLLCGVSES